MAQIMTTRELAKYLKMHEVSILKYANKGIIPAKRIGRVWRFEKEAIDHWIAGGQNALEAKPKPEKKKAKKRKR